MSQINLTPNGRLKNLEEWSEEVAKKLAEKDGIVLTPAHWEIIGLMREYYQSFNISPIRKLLKKMIQERYGAEKTSDNYLDGLFPNGVLAQGSKIAGLPLPMLDAEIESHHYVGTKKAGAATPAAAVAYYTGEVEFAGKRYQLQQKGNLVNPDEWSEALANHMAKKEGITLTPEHWEVLNYLRKFYFKYGIMPMVRLLMKHMREDFGAGKSSQEYLYKLFPGGPSRQGSRIAGLPEPQGCIDD
jgi:tRNA 2-thiouridine synthesizing protein E